ncbi:MAG: hypothetical protein AAB074_02695 [Planctomycetota bacterium]
MIRRLSLLALALAGGCKADPGDTPLKAWDRLRAAVAADDSAAALASVSAATRSKELAGAELLRHLPPKSLPPSLAARAKPDETVPWSAERIAGETLLLAYKGLWQVPLAESATVETVSAGSAAVVSLNPRNRVRWALVLEDGAWKFDIAASHLAPREPGSATGSTTECANRLRQTGIDIALFESKFKGYPSDWADLRASGVQRSDACTRCSFGETAPFEYRFPIDGDHAPPDWLMAWDPELHVDGRRNILYFQGRADLIAESEFQKRLEAQNKNVAGRIQAALEAARNAAAASPGNAVLKRRVRGLEELTSRTSK